MAFFIGMNLILTVLLLFAVLILYLRQNRLLELEKKYDELNRELENSMAAYLIEIREENNEFLKKFKETMEQKSPLAKEPSDHEVFGDVLEQTKIEELEDNREEMVLSNEKIVENNKDEQPSHSKETLKKERSANQVLYHHEDLKRKVKTLLEAGFSDEEIAKQLDRGKTEIRLLIKFDPELLAIERNQMKK